VAINGNQEKSVTNRLKPMRALFLFVVCVAVCLSDAAAREPQKRSQSSGPSSGKAHVPPAGSAERKGIMDGLRGDQKVVFKVHYLKVHGDWAFVDVTPLDDKGKPVAEGGASLMHKENSAWKVKDLSALPEDPDNPMGADDPSPKFVKAVQKAFPGIPSDIFPSRARPK
jgi:hypothetical protein